MSTSNVTGTVGTATDTPAAASSTITTGTTSIIQGSVGNILNKAQTTLNNYLPPSTRADLKTKLANFASSRPILSSFLLSHIVLSGLPLALFFISAITITIFALVSGILVGLIGALLFIIFAIGLALFILLPILLVTTFFAVAVWLGGIVTYYIVKRLNEKKGPGIHVPFVEGLIEQSGLKPGFSSSLNGAAGKKESNGSHPDGKNRAGNGARYHEKNEENGVNARGTKNESYVKAGHDDKPSEEKQVRKVGHDEPSGPKSKPVDDAGVTVSNVEKGLTG